MKDKNKSTNDINANQLICNNIVQNVTIPLDLSTFTLSNNLVCTGILTSPFIPVVCDCQSCPKNIFCEVTGPNTITVTALVQITFPIAVPCPGGFSTNLSTLCGNIPDGSQLTTATKLVTLTSEIIVPNACLILSCSSSFGPLGGCSSTVDRSCACLSITVDTVFGGATLEVCAVTQA